MTRCDYDAVFYRVFCVTLLAIAFTFTVILSNVFIDIDGLLAKKHNSRMSDNIISDEFTSEATDNEDLNYGENDDSYRTKRSIETQSYLFHIKNPKIKNILANRLSTLLEELEAEEAKVDHKPKEKNPNKDLLKDVEIVDTAKLAEDKKKKSQKDEDILHLRMHNILLQGIIGHMDLDDVYKKVHSLMANFKKDGSVKLERDGISKIKTSEVRTEKAKTTSKPTEKFFEEVVNCNELQNEIQDAKQTIKSNGNKVPNVMIKTVIDIRSLDNDKHKENDTKNSKENIKGVVELIYNGNTIKFTNQDVDKIQTPQKKQIVNIDKPKPIKLNKVNNDTTIVTDSDDVNKISKSYFNKFLEDYFKRFPQDKKISTEIKEQYETKRSKRHVKLKYNENVSKEKTEEKKTEDDELYVEIETHFDSKGLKGEKKKKLVRSLIEKIQKAIHSDMDGKLVGKEGKNKKIKKIHFRKRLQDPLEHRNHGLSNKYTIPTNPVIHRQLNPISKTITIQESSPYIGGRNGEDWKKPCPGPGFLTASKSINSAEMSEVAVDYTKVLDVNGIPQRLQHPINTEMSEETVNMNSYYDLGKMKFFIKDIDGSGFSVGFNQYTDEPPDAETMSLFTGLENVIKTYHQNYDPADPTTESNLNVEERNQESSSNDHIIARRSINKQHDHHTNEYKIIFDNNFLPFNDYRDIFENKKFKTHNEFDNIKNEVPLIVDENIFEKNLRPAEIFGLASLLERKKRSMKVKKISNLKSKIKLNRYLNTKAMSTKRIYLNNKKRNKRQINKIRIIATDLPHMSKNSDENVFVVSDENIFADRAIVKEIETSEVDHDKQEEAEYVPYQSEDNGTPTYITKIFDRRSRHNPLMSKYPHIFMEEISKSREEYIPDNALLFGKIPGFAKMNHNIEAEKFEDKLPEEQNPAPVPNATESSKLQKVDDPVNAPKANYKVTVKIIPKNMTDLNSGFKEIHTSINKRFNKNGLLYSSLVNVSEISKVIKLNRSIHGVQGVDSHMAKKIREQQEKMQFLLKEHAKHINEQLNRLNEEKINLETILEEESNDTETVSGHLDYDELEAGNPSNSPNPPEEEHVATEKPTTQPTTTEVHEVIHEHTTIRSTTNTGPPPTPPHPPAVLYDKIKKTIMNTIEKNGNLTDQILKKIDTNTELLQMFLKKLTDRIQAPMPKAQEGDEAKVTKYVKAFPTDWTNHGMQFNQNMVIRKNDSHISIPFVYAYQQSLMPHPRGTPVTSLIYHGHVHSNTIHTKDSSAEKKKLKPAIKIPETNNQSRFFIDDLENDYKVIQVGDVKNNSHFNKVNDTRAHN